MQNKFFKILFFFVAIALWASCEKAENKAYYQSGTAPVLTSNAPDNLVLNKDMPNEGILPLSWTNPNYTFNTGLSSQNVNYYIQVDTVGANFTSPRMQQYSVTSELGTNLTNAQLNTLLLSLGLDFGKAYDVEMRLKSVLGTSFAVPLISNVITRTITPYSVEPDLWITGNYNADINWTDSPNENQKFAYDAVSKTLYITVNFEPGREYKFLAKHGQWQPQYGGAPATGGTLTVNMESGGTDPAPMITPSVAGSYKLTVDLENMTLKVEKV